MPRDFDLKSAEKKTSHSDAVQKHRTFLKRRQSAPAAGVYDYPKTRPTKAINEGTEPPRLGGRAARSSSYGSGPKGGRPKTSR